MRIGSLFSGAGGLDMAVERVFGGRTVWHCELTQLVDKEGKSRPNAATKVLTHRWPGVPNLDDISLVDWATVEPVDVLCGGFPCQDISAVGKRAGMGAGTRSGLWSEFARAIDELRPTVVVIENVRNLLSVEAKRAVESAEAAMGDGDAQPVLRALGAVLGDLSDLGYDAQWTTVSAASVGAPHLRERVFILATNTAGDGWARIHDSPGGTAACSRRERIARGSARRSLDSVELLPTPNASDGTGGGQHPDKRVGHSRQLIDYVLLCTPSAADGGGGHLTRSGSRKDEPLLPGQAREMAQEWGKYTPAIERWESVTRPAPPPTESNRNGKPRLNPEFSNWMMGWPAGWVTDVPGISRNDQLRIIGNGVCPQQATAALSWLLSVSEVAA